MVAELAHVTALFFEPGDADSDLLGDLVNYDWLLIPGDDSNATPLHITHKWEGELDQWVEMLPPPAGDVLHPPHIGRVLRPFIAVRVTYTDFSGALGLSLEEVGQDILINDARELATLGRHLRQLPVEKKPGSKLRNDIDFSVVYISTASYDDVEHHLVGLCIGLVAASPGQSPSVHNTSTGHELDPGTRLRVVRKNDTRP